MQEVELSKGHDNHIRIGDTIKPHELVSITGTHLSIPDPARLTHLQFRRYAGCPVCNLHLRSFARRNNELVNAGIREIVVFHSKRETMMEFQGQLPFAAVADPDKKLYDEFDANRKMSPYSP